MYRFNRLSPSPVKYLSIVLLMLLTTCDIIPKKVSMDDPQIRPLLKAASLFDRTSYGFTPLPESADVRFESKPTGVLLMFLKTCGLIPTRYDFMLHIGARTSRTIAFRKTRDGYKWIGEQEILEGPKKFTTVDGTFFESICLNYDIETVSGDPANQLVVTYSGEDPRLENRFKLTLKDVQPILKEWGY